MRKLLYSFCALAAVMTAVGCNETIDNELTQVSGKDCDVTVQIVGSTTTKSTPEAETLAANEGRVASLQVFVFNEDGSYENSDFRENVKMMEVTCKSGKKTVCAVVNAPLIDKASITKLDDLRATAENLSSMAVDKFIMYGETAQFIEGSSDVVIEVNRLVARVVIKSIENRMKLEVNQQKTLVVDAIYLINVQGSNNFGLSAYQTTDGVWYNKMAHQTCAVEPMLYDTVGKTINYTETYSTAHYFYAGPNDFAATEQTPDLHAGTWAPRYTRLVVEVTLGGEKMYYPITMSVGFKANKSYEIEKLILTKRGSNDPDTPVTSEDVLFKIDILPWDVVLMGNEGVIEI